jgi:hypothetical protein
MAWRRLLKMVAITPTHPKRAKTRSFPRSYVEDFFEPRTKLEAFFSILPKI